MSILSKLQYLIESEILNEEINLNIKNRDDDSEDVISALEKIEKEVDDLDIDIGYDEEGRLDMDESYEKITFKVKVDDLEGKDVLSFVKGFVEIPNKIISYEDNEFELKPELVIVDKINNNEAVFEIRWNVA